VAELDESLIHAVCAKVRVGQWPQRALVACGVPGPDALRWLDAGHTAQKEGVSPDDDLYVRLVAALDVAEADCEATWIAAILGASGKGANWARYGVLLDKRWPERYGRTPVAGNGRGHDKRDTRTLEDMVAEFDKAGKKDETP
jgi:hypothetical protein